VRVALLHPTYWPEVRRGSERLIHDLGTALVERGHDVSILTSHPGLSSRSVEDGLVVDRAHRLPQRGPLRWYEQHVTTAPAAAARLAKGQFDLAHAFYPVEAWAAIGARERLGGPPVLASHHGIIDRAWLVKRRYRLEMHAAIARRADEVSVLSEAAARPYRRYFGREPMVLPGGVVAAPPSDAIERADPPVVLCAASIGDPRKRGPLLLEAFGLLRERVPDVRLRIVRTPDPHLSAAVDALPEGAEWIDAEESGSLRAAYAAASVSVLPSVDEAFGLVLVESLAAGTPVVAARSGAAPEIVTGDDVGLLFEPDDPASLADALERGLALGADPAPATACRAAAEPWHWDRVVDRYLDVYERLASTN
jgi:glycosyltransferase involved in cell wall biosynthesis